MSSTINKAFVEQYKKNVILLAQQKASKQRNTVTVQDVTGRSAYVEAIGKSETQPITTRHAATPILDTPYRRRQLLLGDWAWGEMIDTVDRIRMLIDPTDKYVQSATGAFGRRIDQVINTAMLGDARAGMTGETTVPLPADRQIDTGTNPMSLEVLLEIKYKFDIEDVPEDEIKYLIISPYQLQELLDEDKLTNADYNTVKALVRGELDSFLGFKFITSNLLNIDSNDKRHCIAYTKDALTLGIGSEPRVEIAKDPAYSFNTRLYMEMSLGAVRVQEEKVVEILVPETT